MLSTVSLDLNEGQTLLTGLPPRRSRFKREVLIVR
jgi:hypothetical protein